MNFEDDENIYDDGTYYDDGTQSPECIDLVTDSEEEMEEEEEDEKMIAYVQPEAVYQKKTRKSSKPRKNSHNQNKLIYQRNRLFLSLTFDCTECDQTAFPSENLYKKHLRDDHAIFNHRCYVPYCQQTFKRNIFLENHLSRCHSKEIDWKCSFCLQTHVSHAELKKHFELNHQLGTFVCNYKGGCKFEVGNREYMLQHLRESHVDNPEGKITPKNYICNFEGCEQAFTTNALVRRHQLFHLKIKPYSCKLCDYESEVKYATIVHIRTVHMGLPAYVRDQQAKNIVDNRDPADYLHVAIDKLNQINACAKNIKHVK